MYDRRNMPSLAVCFMSALPLAAVVILAACATPAPPTMPQPPPPPELDVDRICSIIVDVADASARGGLVARRHALELQGQDDRHAAFGLMLAEATPEERFAAFHRDLQRSPTSVVGPLGECIVYGSWNKMGAQTTKSCDAAAARLGSAAVLVEIARSSSALLHDGDAARAIAIADAALARAPGCAALHVAKAQAIAAQGNVESARDGWRAASQAVPTCFRCLVEAAAAEERVDTGPGGRAAAVPLWEEALKLAPEHPDTLRRFAAATAGVDDSRTRKAYAAAVNAGAKDYPTLLAAAKLSARLAETPAAIDEAIMFARRASEAAKGAPEPRRIVVELTSKIGALDAVIVAANALLELVADDAVAHIALARVAVERGPLASAVIHYGIADRAMAATPGDPALMASLRVERQSLLARLLVDESKLPSGTAAAVAAATQKNLQVLWRERIKTQEANKGGDLAIVVETDSDGHVATTVITADSVGDQMVSAAAVAWLSRATIKGGARRYTLDFALR